MGGRSARVRYLFRDRLPVFPSDLELCRLEPVLLLVVLLVRLDDDLDELDWEEVLSLRPLLLLVLSLFLLPELSSLLLRLLPPLSVLLDSAVRFLRVDDATDEDDDEDDDDVDDVDRLRLTVDLRPTSRVLLLLLLVLLRLDLFVLLDRERRD